MSDNVISPQFNDPKVFLTISIMRQVEEITFYLAQGYDGTAGKAIALLLLQLDIPDDEKEMVQLRKDVTTQNYNTLGRDIIYKAFSLLCEFLNRTYYKDYRRAKPRFGSSGKL
jgi:hypothetical protein